ncbi:hypothetical protein GW933_00585 [Candidatus Falkowbacteria bacterium]|uniref:Uncharacterized protein n=1 Tax=Candidatus Buchananbacteria bacterium CG10_big_fil_rev_8_21_14_0_10_33_19 TaxID=1974525 RepID=A0A2H0W331_9BACT|nr:hypothetical protein [Candidatus Falkowbacteria bacterium]PIS05756.1 MAG: hypothetical protein COT80_03210 [Candidatus Buchananbacteria bacterium CG10_big_fil_rev_8_21_14_0_10_33_19]
MKKFANLLGLSYKISDKRFALFEFKKNIISGKYKGKYIEIYDYYLNAGSMSQKRTVIEISGEAINIYRGITFEYVPIISVRTIKKILDEYFNDGGVKTRGKIKKEIYVALLVLVAVFFVFMWYYLTSLTV